MKQVKKVVGAIIIKDGYVLCGRRKNEGECASNWEFPGGKVEQNETEEMALIREIKEELNLEITVLNKMKSIIYEYKTFILDMSLYLVKITGGTIQNNYHTEIAWIKTEKLNDYEFCDADKVVINELLNRK